MEKMEQLLENYGRFLELEDRIPIMEQQVREKKPEVLALRYEIAGKKWEVDALENPGFFKRLMGKLEEKREKAWREYREAVAAHEAAKRELEDMEQILAAAKQEQASLAGSGDAYEQAKQEACLTPEQQVQLKEKEVAAFTPVAAAIANKVIAALEEARIWMREDAVRRGVRQDNRKMEYLALAEENARRLVDILSIMPEGCAGMGSYLRNPNGYIYGVTSEFKQLDRLNSAIDQIRETRNQLGMRQ